MRLNKEDWDELDKLLGKHGFGGYYDLVESLKICLNNLGFSGTGIDTDDIKTLPEIVSILNLWTNKISLEDDFDELLDKLLEKIANENKEN